MYDVIVIGGGPAGLSAAIEADRLGAKVLLVEREQRLGGILKQCIHDGFGLIRYKEMLTGPEYALNDIEALDKTNITIMASTFLTKIEKEGDFKLTLVNGGKGVFEEIGRSLVLANGCRERTSKQIFINGTRPAGVLSAGTAQYLVNIDGYLPCKKCVILGSGDIGLIMARRLTLEGAEVLGVYEAKSTPSGLQRNIQQCLKDYNIPLHLSKTVTRIFGASRVEAVEVMSVDEQMQPIVASEEVIACDGLILSVGLIPENETAEALDVMINPNTKGPMVDQNLMTSVSGVFSCGNALHVNDLVDYVSESGVTAGKNAAAYSNDAQKTQRITIDYDSNDLLYLVPQQIDISKSLEDVIIYFRSKTVIRNITIQLLINHENVYKRHYKQIKPPEMERLKLNFKRLTDQFKDIETIELKLERMP